jgi:hypothetical protein
MLIELNLEEEDDDEEEEEERTRWFLSSGLSLMDTEGEEEDDRSYGTLRCEWKPSENSKQAGEIGCFLCL